jgi:hypothetical protein
VLFSILLQDPVQKIRNSAAWTFGKIAESLTHYCLNPHIRDHLLSNLLAVFDMKIPRASSHICWALINLTDKGQLELNGEQFDQIIEKLLLLAYSDQSTSDSVANLRVSSYAAIGALIEKIPVNGQTEIVIANKVEKFVTMLGQIANNDPANEDNKIFLTP